MNNQFETNKNLKAGGYTALVCSLLLVVFIFVRWTLPEEPELLLDEGLEVNLGSSDEGFGDDQPFEPGSPAPSSQQAYTPPTPTPAVAEQVKDIETDDRDEEAPTVTAPKVVHPNATKVAEKEVATKKVTAKPVETPPAPPVQKPKTVFKGSNGTGTGGNEADTYKKGGNQGIAGGTGDQGRPGGNPDSDNYTGGGTGNGSGIRTESGIGNRKVNTWPKMTDDFNERGIVMIAVKFDQNGRAIESTIVPKGTTGGLSLQNIAKRKAQDIKLNVDESAPATQTVTFRMNFVLTN
jgi:hypothetical protein